MLILLINETDSTTVTHPCFSWSQGVFAHSGLQNYFLTNRIKEYTISVRNKKPPLFTSFIEFIENTKKRFKVFCYHQIMSLFQCISVWHFALKLLFSVSMYVSIVVPVHINENWKVDFAIVKNWLNFEVTFPGCIFH